MKDRFDYSILSLGRTLFPYERHSSCKKGANATTTARIAGSVAGLQPHTLITCYTDYHNLPSKQVTTTKCYNQNLPLEQVTITIVTTTTTYVITTSYDHSNAP